MTSSTTTRPSSAGLTENGQTLLPMPQGAPPDVPKTPGKRFDFGGRVLAAAYWLRSERVHTLGRATWRTDS